MIPPVTNHWSLQALVGEGVRNSPCSRSGFSSVTHPLELSLPKLQTLPSLLSLLACFWSRSLISEGNTSSLRWMLGRCFLPANKHNQKQQLYTCTSALLDCRSSGNEDKVLCSIKAQLPDRIWTRNLLNGSPHYEPSSQDSSILFYIQEGWTYRPDWRCCCSSWRGQPVKQPLQCYPAVSCPPRCLAQPQSPRCCPRSSHTCTCLYCWCCGWEACAAPLGRGGAPASWRWRHCLGGGDKKHTSYRWWWKTLLNQWIIGKP